MEDYSAYTDEELIMRIHNDKNDHGDNNEIMDYILEKYKPLVRKKTNALYLIGGENDDLIQEGMIGLFKAVRDYKSDKEASFYSFAQLCIISYAWTTLFLSTKVNMSFILFHSLCLVCQCLLLASQLSLLAVAMPLL